MEIKEKKKMSELTKAKLIFSGEFLFFSFALFIIGALIICRIIPEKDWKKWTFTIITFVGSFWAIIDFIWFLNSKKRRAKNCMLDKVLLLPSAAVLIGLDSYAFANLAIDPSWKGTSGHFFSLFSGIIMVYLGAVFLFIAVYHWYIPHPMIYEMIEDEDEKARLLKTHDEITEASKKEYEDNIKMLKKETSSENHIESPEEVKARLNKKQDSDESFKSFSIDSIEHKEDK